MKPAVSALLVASAITTVLSAAGLQVTRRWSTLWSLVMLIPVALLVTALALGRERGTTPEPPSRSSGATTASVGYPVKEDADGNLALKDGDQQIFKFIRSTKTLELGAGNVIVTTGKSQKESLETVRQRTLSNMYAWQNMLLNGVREESLPKRMGLALAAVMDSRMGSPVLAYSYQGRWYRASDNTVIP